MPYASITVQLQPGRYPVKSSDKLFPATYIVAEVRDKAGNVDREIIDIYGSGLGIPSKHGLNIDVMKAAKVEEAKSLASSLTDELTP